MFGWGLLLVSGGAYGLLVWLGMFFWLDEVFYDVV